jgi:ADP-dependent phosphofructokinase/glucokinase
MPSVSLLKYSGDYVLPLFYPDVNIWTILYLKRLRANMFLDYMKGWNIYNTTINPLKFIPYKEFHSEGLELYADYHLFHIIFEFSSGIRFTYIPEDKKIRYQFLFTVNLNKF